MTNVVVVSDQVFAREIIAQALSRDGYRVICLDGCRCRENGVMRHCPDVLLVDGDLDIADTTWDGMPEWAGVPVLRYGLKQDGVIGKVKMSVAHAIGSPERLPVPPPAPETEWPIGAGSQDPEAFHLPQSRSR